MHSKQRASVLASHHAVAEGVVADPAFVGGFAGKLIARVGRETDAVFRAFVIDGAMEREHTEDEQIARLEFRGKPASAVPLLRLTWFLGQPAAAVGVLSLSLSTSILP